MKSKQAAAMVGLCCIECYQRPGSISAKGLAVFLPRAGRISTKGMDVFVIRGWKYFFQLMGSIFTSGLEVVPSKVWALRG